jgi:hypothetical protein
VRTRQAAGEFNLWQGSIENEMRQNFFSKRVVAPWNSLSEMSETVNKFKSCYGELITKREG